MYRTRNCERQRSCLLSNAKTGWLSSELLLSLETVDMGAGTWANACDYSVHYVDFNKRLDGMSLFRRTTLAWLLMSFL